MKSITKRAKQLLVLATTLALLVSPWAVHLTIQPVSAIEEGGDPVTPPCEDCGEYEDDCLCDPQSPANDDNPVGDDDPGVPPCDVCEEPLDDCLCDPGVPPCEVCGEPLDDCLCDPEPDPETPETDTTPADLQGLMPLSDIMPLSGDPVTTLAELRTAIETANTGTDPVTILLERPSGATTGPAITIPAGENINLTSTVGITLTVA